MIIEQNNAILKEIDGRKKFSDEELLKYYVNHFIDRCENSLKAGWESIIVVTDELRKKAANAEEEVKRVNGYLIDAAYRLAYWRDLKFMIDYGESAIEKDIDQIVDGTLIYLLSGTENLITRLKANIVDLNSENPRMRRFTLTAESPSITIDLSKKPSREEFDEWIKDDESSVEMNLALREEMLRVLYILQETYESDVTFNPIDFKNLKE